MIRGVFAARCRTGSYWGEADMEHTPELTAALPAAKEITPTSAVLGSSIPFHPGALRYFKEKGISVPAI
jgi:uncharacterized protein